MSGICSTFAVKTEATMTKTAIQPTLFFKFILIALILFLSGCKSDSAQSNRNTPSATVASFNSAILARDYKRALTLTDTDEEEYPLYEAWMKLMFDEMTGATLDVLTEEIAPDSSSALVKVKLTNGKTHDTLYTKTVKAGGLWRIRLDE